MHILATISVILAVVIVLVVAWHLISIAISLKKTGDALEALAGGLTAVRDHTAPLGNKVGAINDGLAALHAHLDQVRQGLGDIANLARRLRG